MLDFSGMKVLVTGGAGGIGTEICRQLHAFGAEVVVHYYNSKLQAEDLATPGLDFCESRSSFCKRFILQIDFLWYISYALLPVY